MLIDPLTLIVSSLAVFRVAELIAFDAGPFHMFKKWREIWKKHPYIQELFTCYYCVSGYVSAGVVIILWLYDVDVNVLHWPGVWGGAVVIFRALPDRD